MQDKEQVSKVASALFSNDARNSSELSTEAKGTKSAGELHLASDDYPELYNIIRDRLPPESLAETDLRMASLSKEDAESVAFAMWTLDGTKHIKEAGLFNKWLKWRVDKIQDKAPEWLKDKPGENYSEDWCAYRDHEHCWYPDTLDPEGTKEAGYAVWVPKDRGVCPRNKWSEQKACTMSKPGEKSGEAIVYSTPNVSWEDGGQRFVGPVLATTAALSDDEKDALWDYQHKPAPRMKSNTTNATVEKLHGIVQREAKPFKGTLHRGEPITAAESKHLASHPLKPGTRVNLKVRSFSESESKAHGFAINPRATKNFHNIMYHVQGAKSLKMTGDPRMHQKEHLVSGDYAVTKHEVSPKDELGQVTHHIYLRPATNKDKGHYFRRDAGIITHEPELEPVMAAYNPITWYADDPDYEWFGWSEDRTPEDDAHDWLVKNVGNDGQYESTWAGWVVFDDGERECVTKDYPFADLAKQALQDHANHLAMKER